MRNPRAAEIVIVAVAAAVAALVSACGGAPGEWRQQYVPS